MVLKKAVAGKGPGDAERRVHAGVSKTDDIVKGVRAPVVKATDHQKGEESRVLLDPPSSSFITEIRQNEVWILKGAVSVAECNPHPIVSEANNVRTAITSEIGEEARMLVDAPSTGRVCAPITEIRQNEVWILKGAVSVSECSPHPSVSEANNVRTAITSEIGEEARMLVDAPSASFESEVADDQPRRLERAVAVAECRPHAIVSEANNVRTNVRKLLLNGSGFAREVREEAWVPFDPPSCRHYKRPISSI